MARKWRENGFTRLLRESLEMMGIGYAPMVLFERGVYHLGARRPILVNRTSANALIDQQNR
jgi:hypothetical protein